MRIDHFLLADGDAPLRENTICSERKIEEFLGLPGHESLAPAKGDHEERAAPVDRLTGLAERC
ncbi:hypothetical protein [Streptomyces rubradiris]|uniref:Uncharacterized protein n=1 Tax=Streptomyces rubradiris TaxID=285531 RepID=A0ABQ3R462_STRRR|nr:hypothetical protein [Streptomyces rubradiris]GHH05597.1 hypothetical protein GCM10018792_24030 [Streptomyces rubradiris]GHI50651.1 hypothetical protein Srubr_04970 [Streptomyces rubradiris]